MLEPYKRECFALTKTDMFRHLHLRLTLLYLLAALALIASFGGGTYVALRHYLRSTTDLALEHKMVHEFHMLAAPIPPDLAAADQDWSTLRGGGLLPRGRGPEEGGEGGGARPPFPAERRERDLAFDGELAAIFVLPLSREGRLLFDPNPSAAPIVPDQDAVASALANGSDWRTIQNERGVAVRLLTYRFTRPDGPAVLQLGRALADQDRVLGQLLSGLLLLGGASVVLMGAGSWWLAGRSLRPAQEAWERQQAFVANASHELRTPLTLLRASAEVALRGLPAGDADRRELLGDVLHEADHMSRMVDDLLLLSRLDTGQLQVERAPVALPELLADIERQVGRLAAERDVSLRVTAAAGIACADATRLRQVLLILLDNALRHTPPGGSVTMEAGIAGQDGGHPPDSGGVRLPSVIRRPPAVVLRITDTGVGISPEHLPHIFERFYRVDTARGHGGGHGLGLSIARGLVSAMGGSIRAESAPGQGTRMCITLPAA